MGGHGLLFLPEIGNGDIVQRTQLALTGIMRLIGTINQQRRGITNTGKSIPEARGDTDPKIGIRAPEFDLLQLPACHRLLPIVIDKQTNSADRNSQILSLGSVSLPGLHGTRQHFGKITFTESAEDRKSTRLN